MLSDRACEESTTAMWLGTHRRRPSRRHRRRRRPGSSAYDLAPRDPLVLIVEVEIDSRNTVRNAPESMRPRKARRFAPGCHAGRVTQSHLPRWPGWACRHEMRTPCRFVPSSGSSRRNPLSRAPACTCAAPSASADTNEFDPFLLLDDFRNDNPEDYLAGFPWHPHRGIETITYVLAGTVEHGDSLGNRGASRRGRRPVDDRRQRDPPPGDAEGRSRRAGCTASSSGRICPRR